MSHDRWILSSVWTQHIYSHLLVCTLLPWFPFSLLVGNLTSVNGINQWSIIKLWTIMFNLNTFIHVMENILIVVCAEHLRAWWNHTYSTSLIMSVFMRCHLSWPNSSILSYIFIHYGNIVHSMCMVMTTHDIYISCLFMSIVILCI